MSDRIQDAISALAALYPSGELLASTMPDRLLMLAVEEIESRRQEAAAVAAYLRNPGQGPVPASLQSAYFPLAAAGPEGECLDHRCEVTDPPAHPVRHRGGEEACSRCGGPWWKAESAGQVQEGQAPAGSGEAADARFSAAPDVSCDVPGCIALGTEPREGHKVCPRHMAWPYELAWKEARP